MVGREPEFRDRVKHKTSADHTTGVVIAKYPAVILNGEMIKHPKPFKLGLKQIDVKQYLDVRGDDDKIYWETPAANWEVIKAYDENSQE